MSDTYVLVHGAWHTGDLLERLGLLRYVECNGSHELLFTDPTRFAEAIVLAGRD